MLAKKFNLGIADTLPKGKKRGRKLAEFTDEERAWVVEALDDPTLTYINPGKNDSVYIGKFEGKKDQFL